MKIDLPNGRSSEIPVFFGHRHQTVKKPLFAEKAIIDECSASMRRLCEEKGNNEVELSGYRVSRMVGCFVKRNNWEVRANTLTVKYRFKRTKPLPKNVSI